MSVSVTHAKMAANVTTGKINSIVSAEMVGQDLLVYKVRLKMESVIW